MEIHLLKKCRYAAGLRAWGLAFAALLSVGLSAIPAHADTFTWVGPGHTWDDDTAWNPPGIPGPSDTANIGADFSVVMDSDVTVQNINVGKGTRLSGVGNLTFTGTGNFTDMRISGNGTFNVPQGALMNIDSQGNSYGPLPEGSGVTGHINTRLDRNVTLAGVVNWNSGNVLAYKGLTISPTSVVRVRSSGVIAQDPAAPTIIVNQGNLQKNGTGDTIFTMPVQNNGTISAIAGQMKFNNTFTQTAGATKLKGGSMMSNQQMMFQGGRVDGIGTIQAQVVNNGAVFAPGNSPGSIVINGSYVQASNGTLEMEIGGATAGTQYDQLVVNGNASLNGTLSLVPYNGFLPSAGTSFEVLTYLTVSGNFTTVRNGFAGRYFTTTKTPSYLVAQTSSDTTQPNVAIVAPIVDKAYAALATASGSASDQGAGLASVTAKLFRFSSPTQTAGYWNGATWDSSYNASKNERPVNGTNNWTYSLPALENGKYGFTATAKDNAANSRSTSQNVFWIDTVAPTSVTILKPVANATVSGIPETSGACSDGSGSGIVRVDVYIKRNSDSKYWTGTAWSNTLTYLTTTLNGSATTWIRNTSMPSGANLINGQYTVNASAVDRATLKKATSVTVTVQAPAPIAAPATHLVAAQQADDSVQLTFSSPLDADKLAAAHFSLQLDGKPLTGAQLSSNGTKVTLTLPSSTLTGGSTLDVAWSNLHDAAGTALSGQTSLSVALD